MTSREDGRPDGRSARGETVEARGGHQSGRPIVTSLEDGAAECGGPNVRVSRNDAARRTANVDRLFS